MITLLPIHFEPLVVTRGDIEIASIAWGFTLGFGFLTSWTAIKQTSEVYQRYGFSKLNSPYIWMIWLEIFVCLLFSIMCWLHLKGVIPPSFAFFFVILTTWALQVQFLLQIIINRIAILMVNGKKAMRLKIGVAVLITLINISVYNIWIPARLQISPRYEQINIIWDRCEKVIYLLVDAALNWYFIQIVRERLVRRGMVKYDPLVKFNMAIIGFSLSMDCLIIGMMSLNNSFVYMQFHPLAYIVKLNIEMSMADLIAKVSRSSNNTGILLHNEFAKGGDSDLKRGVPTGRPGDRPGLKAKSSFNSSISSFDVDRTRTFPSDGEMMVSMKKEVNVSVERRKSVGSGSGLKGEQKQNSENMSMTTFLEDDRTPLKEDDERALRTGVQRGMGVYTKVWGP